MLNRHKPIKVSNLQQSLIKMNEQEQLAKYYFDTKNSLDEQRRVIDFDMRKNLERLKQDKTTDGNLKVLRYKSEIQSAEVAYEDRISELRSISDDLYPILAEINANRNDPFTIHVEGRTYFDIFINEEKSIQIMDLYTKT